MGGMVVAEGIIDGGCPAEDMKIKLGEGGVVMEIVVEKEEVGGGDGGGKVGFQELSESILGREGEGWLRGDLGIHGGKCRK
ncbi:hypothetical protein ACLOJK_005082 [Asimina triloba]